MVHTRRNFYDSPGSPGILIHNILRHRPAAGLNQAPDCTSNVGATTAVKSSISSAGSTISTGFHTFKWIRTALPRIQPTTTFLTNQPLSAVSTQAPNSIPNSATAPANSSTAQENQQSTADSGDRSHGHQSSVSQCSRQGRKRGGAPGASRGSTAMSRGSRKPPRSWTKDRNADGKSELDLIINWLTVEDHFSTWRNQSLSKREANGFGHWVHDWKGVEQQ
ncbi:hypothetical protein PTTG_12250, partial [Puccinia triticina 1-1 BBBD Race 1]